jgi:hypothetical protein
VPADPQDVRSWGEVCGAFFAGLLGLRGIQVLRSKGSGGATLDDIVLELRETRKVLHSLDTRIQVLGALLERD